MYLGPYFPVYTKINFRWIVDLNVKGETIKHLKDNTGKQLCDLEVGEDLFNNTNHKGKIDTLDFNKINYFCLPKDKTHKRTHLKHQLQTKGWYPEA